MRKESCERVNRNPAGPGRAGSHIIRNISLRQHTAAHAHATAHTDISDLTPIAPTAAQSTGSGVHHHQRSSDVPCEM